MFGKCPHCGAHIFFKFKQQKQQTKLKQIFQLVACPKCDSFLQIRLSKVVSWIFIGFYLCYQMLGRNFFTMDSQARNQSEVVLLIFLIIVWFALKWTLGYRIASSHHDDS
jgi:surface polysaccharide O-acyltransferase-like enzyme